MLCGLIDKACLMFEALPKFLQDDIDTFWSCEFDDYDGPNDIFHIFIEDFSLIGLAKYILINEIKLSEKSKEFIFPYMFCE